MIQQEEFRNENIKTSISTLTLPLKTCSFGRNWIIISNRAPPPTPYPQTQGYPKITKEKNNKKKQASKTDVCLEVTAGA